MTEIRLQEYIQQVDERVDQGQYDEAVAHLRHILQHYPKFLPAYRLLGKILLETGQDDAAEEMFQRVLSGDPEDFVSRVGLSVIYDRRGDLQRAIWHMERAFELAPDNNVVQEELRRLYGRRDGVVPPRTMLTEGALARLYARGGLFARAAETFRSLLAKEPERVDLKVALAEALWNDGQRVQAEEISLRVLDELPYCLKANLILGEIWTRSGRDEAQVHLRRAMAVDPENQRATDILGDASPLSPGEVRLPYLEYGPPEVQGRPPTVGAPVSEERALVDLERAAEIQIEIPAWLEEIGLGEEGGSPVVEEEGIVVPAWLMPEEIGPETPVAPEVPEAPAPAEIPDWLREVAPPEVKVPEAPAPAEIPEWLREVAPPEVTPPEAPEAPTPAEIPEWLREVAPPEVKAPEAPAPAEIPEWLREVAPPEAKAPEAPAPAEIPEWMREAAPPEAKAPEAPAPAEIPEWLREVAPPEVTPPEAPQHAEMPDALRQAAPPEAKAPEAPTPAEIPGWMREVAPLEVTPPEAPVPAEIPEWLREVAPPEVKAPEAPAPAEIPEWMREAAPPEVKAPEAPTPTEIPEWLREVAPPEVKAPEAPAPEAAPSWLEEGGLPEGEEALAWLASLAAGREAELRATAEAEAEARMAEIMGREVAPPPEAKEPEAPTPAEIPDWLREVAPPEAKAPEAPAPAEIPEWLREVAPPEVKAPEAPAPEAAPSWLEEGGLPEGEEALAWLASLAAGREAELRATAEAEAEARMAEIMGREVAPPPKAKAPEAPTPAEIPDWLREVAPPEVKAPEAPTPAEIPDWLREVAPPEVKAPEAPAPEAAPSWLEEGGLPEGEEALAWLASLAAGREAELRATAEAEAEARMAEIMGREVAPPPEAKAPEAPTPAEIPEWLREVAPPEAKAPEAPAPAEIPEWLREVAPPEVTPPEAPVRAEIPEWLRDLAPPEAEGPEEREWKEEPRELLREFLAPEAEEGLPEWPEEAVPPEIIPELEIPEWVEEVMPPEVPRAEVPPAEPEVFGWTAFGAEEEIIQPPPLVEEISPPEEPFGWTTFGVVAPEVPPEVPAQREPEMPEVEVAPPTEPLEAVAPPEVVPPTVAPPEVVPPTVAPPEVIPPTVMPPEAVMPPPPTPIRRKAAPPPVPEVPASVEALRAHIRARPRDYAARLNLARALWQAGLYADSLEMYSQVLRTGKFMDEVLTDMEQHVNERPNDPLARRVLGDAYMRAERLAEALAEYRVALDLLK